ncbi:hypothetical protein MRX96_006467 [Rhipicephalus microplus]
MTSVPRCHLPCWANGELSANGNHGGATLDSYHCFDARQIVLARAQEWDESGRDGRSSEPVLSHRATLELHSRKWWRRVVRSAAGASTLAASWVTADRRAGLWESVAAAATSNNEGGNKQKQKRSESGSCSLRPSSGLQLSN